MKIEVIKIDNFTVHEHHLNILYSIVPINFNSRQKFFITIYLFLPYNKNTLKNLSKK
ncbi:MAG: hypothetical protein QNJ68_11695 [Microcoleaceae cyanobacterium MO_207.B10]|nr:hypothetical protein [Microcoleaceae cyanobacterium MO_207.B10]